MKEKALSKMSSDELVRAYEKIAVEQDDSFKNERVALFNEQFAKRSEISKELRSRPGDQREALAALFKHPKAWVRMCVASDTFALNEARARMHLEYISEHAWDPYRGQARVTLGLWDMGHRPA